MRCRTRDSLASGGLVAFTEPVWPEGARDVAEQFWADYPAITDLSRLEARIAEAGYETLATRRIVGDAWRTYYDPLEARVAQLRRSGEAGLDEVLDGTAREIALWRQAPEQICYALMLVRPV